MKSLLMRFFLLITALLIAGCAGMPNIPIPSGKGGFAGLIPSGTGAGSSDTLSTAVSVFKDTKDAFAEVPESEEIEIGEAMASGLLGAAPLLANDRIQQYVNRVGKWIALHSERPGLPWSFAVIDSPVPNAFAAPGGKVFITTGLLYRLRSESELAGALGHEIAHVILKHHLHAVQKAGKAGLLTTGLGIFANSKIKDTGLASQIGKGWVKGALSGGKELYVKGLSPEDELQADRVGMVLAARAGYDPFGLPTVLQLLQNLSTDQQASKSLVYSSHPTPSLRLSELDKSIGKSLDQFSSQAVLQERFVAAILGTTPSDLKKPTTTPKATTGKSTTPAAPKKSQ